MVQMSSIIYNNNNHQIPLQQATTAPPLQRYMNQGRRRGGVFGGNNFSRGSNQFSYGGNQYSYRNYRNYPNRRNQNINRDFYPRIFYRRNNYQPQQYYDGCGIVSQPLQQVVQRRVFRRILRRTSQNRQRSRSNQRQSRSIQQRRRGPRPLRLNDFMPPQLRDSSPNLPAEFNLATSTTTNNIPVDTLPQRAIFAQNTTQPFVVSDQGNLNQQQLQNNEFNQRRQITTASFRRRQRRIRQQQYRENEINNNNNNRFAILAENNDGEINVMSNIDESEPLPVIRNNKKNKKNKNYRAYFAYNRIVTWLQNDSISKEIIETSGNHAYLMASIPIYDEWIRANYDLQVWQNYLKMGTENKHWAKEVIQRTKKRDDIVNNQFVKKKINQLSAVVAQPKNTTPATTTTTTEATAATTSKLTAMPLTLDKIRNKVEELEKLILKYLQHCTQHVKKMAETRIQLAKAQMEEFKALEEFEQVATQTQWNIHLILKPKWIYLLKIDESIISQEEVQATYNQMRQITKEFRTQAMTLYVQSLTREHELLSKEIEHIIDGFPQDNDEGFDAEPGFVAFKHYHNLRTKRLNLEAEQSIYFLVEQRVEDEINKQQEELIAPTLIRSLCEEFLLQP
ncbi:unnamed protein product [Rotaria sordida]|uniref:Uncharacterized protein n=2 Tax=Rotaria sordida TaxID=392033 RepID=A0A820AZI0_9BILA|nr:unnamed protein product [Rotaria sordida]